MEFQGDSYGGNGPGPVAYVVKMFPRLSETFITNEVDELRRRGLDLLLVSLMRPAGKVVSRNAVPLAETAAYLPQLAEAPGRYQVLKDHLFLGRRDPWRYLRVLFLVAKRFRPSAWKRFFQAGSLARLSLEKRVSHIHAGFAHTPTSVAFWTHRLTGIPFSFTAHAKDLYLSERASLVHKMERARFVWTCTKSNGDYLRSLGASTPVHVGYHGIDLEFFAPVAAGRGNGGPFRVLAVGRHVPKKGFADLLRAACILRDRGREHVEVVLAGDGPERERLQEMVRELGLESRVRLLGALPQEQVRKEYALADVVVLPCVILENGDRDGIPNVLVEAMSMGVPVVSTNVSAIPELVRDRETGLLISPRSPEELADAIENVLARPDRARERAIRAQADVRLRFDLRANSKPLADLLRSHQRPTRCLYVTADPGVHVRGHKGASAHVRQVAAGFAGAGMEVRVVTRSSGPEPPEGNTFAVPLEEAAAPSRLQRLVDRAPKGVARDVLRELLRLLYNVSLGRRLGILLREMRPDFVYERYSLCVVATGILCRRRRVPWLVEVNAPLAREEAVYRSLRLGGLARHLERWILRHADHLFVVSHPLRRWALEQGAAPHRVTVLPNGVDGTRFHGRLDATPAREAWGWTGDEVVVGFSGSLKPWHGVRLLLDAFRKAYREDSRLRLVYVGEGPERKGLERSVRQHGLGDVVRFTGAVRQDDVPRLLRAADILTAPYLPQDLFYFSPLKVVESLAVGRPVVASRLGDIPDLVDAACGRLVPAGSVGPLADALLELAGDREMRIRMGRAAGRSARRHDWSRRVEEILTVFEEVRGSREPRLRVRVGYVLKMFPRFSETFIVNEILALEEMETEIRVFSMKRPAGPRQESAGRVRARVTVLPQGWGAASPSCALAHVRSFARSPRRYLQALGFALGRRDRRALTKFLQAGVVADRCLKEGVQHLHAHFASGPARVAKMASMISGLPFSFTAHAKDIYWQGHRHTESHKLKKRVRLARFVVTVSEENKRFLEDLGFRVKEGRIRPVYIGIRLDEFPFLRPSLRPRGPRPLILAVGRLIEKKGFHVLVEALHGLRARDVSFRCLIAGDGPQKERLDALIREKGLSGRIRLLGGVPLNRLRRRYYSRAAVLAQPSVIARDGDRDGIPTVLIEAMALGVPVISTRVSGIPEACTDGVDGFLTEPGDADTLARRLEALLCDPTLADRLAAAARRRVELQFDQRKNAGMLRKLFLRAALGWPSREVFAADRSERGRAQERAGDEPAAIAEAALEAGLAGPRGGARS